MLNLVCQLVHLFSCFFIILISLPLNTGQPDALSLVLKVKQVNFMGAISKSGYVYHELLNADGTKAKGVGADEF